MDTTAEMPAPAPPPEAPLPTAPAPAKPRFFSFILSLIFLVLIGTATYYFYQYYALQKPVTLPLVNLKLNPSSNPAASPSPTPAVVATPIPNANKFAVFTRFLDPVGQQQVNVLIDPVTAAEIELDLPTGAVAHKWLASPLLFYAHPDRSGRIMIRDLEKGTEEFYTPFTLDDPNIYINYDFIGYDALSPDGRWLVFGVNFTEPCPTPSPFPSGFQGGFGPCEPAVSLDHPSGAYLYDLGSGKLSFLTNDFYRLSSWDLSEQKLYFTEGSTTKVVNLADRTIEIFDNSPHFGYFTFPLKGEYKLLKFEAATGDSGQSAFGRLDLLNRDGTVMTTIDSVADWAIMQPFITVSPDQKTVLFEKSYLDSSSIRRSYIMKYDLATKTLTRLTSESDPRSYHLRGQWTDNNHYIVKASNFDAPQGTLNSDLVLVNANSGEVTPLTTSHDIFFFDSN